MKVKELFPYFREEANWNVVWEQIEPFHVRCVQLGDANIYKLQYQSSMRSFMGEFEYRWYDSDGVFTKDKNGVVHHKVMRTDIENLLRSELL